MSRPDNTRFGPASEVILCSLWWGSLAGFLELANWKLHNVLVHFPLLLGPKTLWLAPVVTIAAFATVGTMWGVLAFLGRGTYIRDLAFFSFAFLLTANFIATYRQVHIVAGALFAIGVSLLVTRVVHLYPTWVALVRRSALPCVAASLLWSAGWFVGLKLKEELQIQALPPPPETAPNVILIVWDTVRAQSLSTYGYGQNTSPNLSRLAEEGILFEMAVAPASWTLPSHAAFLSGVWADELKGGWNGKLDSHIRTVAQAFSENGYVTAGFVANQLFCSRVNGLHRGFIHYEDFEDPATEWLVSIGLGRRFVTSPRAQALFGLRNFWGRKNADRLTKDFLRWVDKRGQRPFFAFLNFFDAHQPYFAPPPFDEMFGPASWREGIRYDLELRYGTVVDPENLTPEQQQGERNLYDGALAYLDSQLGTLAKGLAARGLLENTVLVVTSDHGEHFGEHGLRDHGNSLYRALLHVPLVLRLPKAAYGGTRVDAPVSLTDLPATLLDLAGLPPSLPGRSLAWRWQNDPSQNSPPVSPPEPVYASLRPLTPPLKGDFFMDAVIEHCWWYIHDYRGGEELYNWRVDPEEKDNLALKPEFSDRLHFLRQAIKDRAPRSAAAAFPKKADLRVGVRSNTSPGLRGLSRVSPVVGEFVVLLGLLGLAQLLHLVAVLSWTRWRTVRGRYFALSKSARLRFRRTLQLHKNLLTPAIAVLRRLGPIRLEKATFHYRGVAGPKGSCSPSTFQAASRYRPQSCDVFVVTQLRCGTTWMQQLVYQILMRGSNDIAASGRALGAVSPWLESYWTIPPAEAPRVGIAPTYRIIKTHLPVELCPFSPEARYIYVARHPVDCFASCLDFLQANVGPFRLSVEDTLRWFCSEHYMWWTPWPRHVAAWFDRAKKERNVLFLTYEEMCRNLPEVITHVAAFLGVEELGANETERILHHASFFYMQAFPEAFEMYPPHLFQDPEFLFRRGRPGRGEYLPPEVKNTILDFCRHVLGRQTADLSLFYPELQAPQREHATTS